MQNLQLNEYSAEAFCFHLHHYQLLVVMVDLAAMGFVFWFIGIRIAEKLV